MDTMRPTMSQMSSSSKRRRFVSTSACAAAASSSRPAAPLFTSPSLRRRESVAAPSPSALLAGIGRNLHLADAPATRRSVSASPSSPRATPSTPLRVPKTPATSRKISRTPASANTPDKCDRFIPNRPAMDLDLCNHILLNDNLENEPLPGSDAPAPLRREFQQALRDTLLSPMGGGCSLDERGGGMSAGGIAPRVLKFTERRPPQADHYTNVLKVLHSSSNTSIARASVGRSIPSAPLRILDAPDLVDDYYLNLISWGHNNVLAVALGQAVYLWNATTGSIDHLLTLPEHNDFVTSVEWMGQEGGSFLAVGTNHSPIQLWDASRLKLVRTMTGHSARVGTLAWKRHILSSGSRDSTILQHDVRIPSHKVASYVGHHQEVCGLKWSPDGGTLASGGNENFLCLWDANMSGTGRMAAGRRVSGENTHKPRTTLVEHKAAVKALAWCPFQRHLLGSGGGTADRTIKFWNTANGSVINSVDTGSQVCALQWSRHNKEIVSSHGFSENQLSLWKYPNMLKIKEFRGHTSRVLHMDTSPDGSTVVSAAADETLRFWDMFGTPRHSKGNDQNKPCGTSGSLTSMHHLR